MAEKDIVTKNFMSDNVRFADAFNYLLFDGEQVIKPDSLSEVDSTETVVEVKTKDALVAQKFRDVLKYTTVKQDSNVYYVMLGIENQTKSDKTMVVRNMVYDAMQYLSQIKSGEKYLKPVITLVIYYDSNKWTDPRSLYDMMYPGFKENIDKRFLNYIYDYKLNIIEPCAVSRGNLDKLTSDLKPVLSYINALYESKKTDADIDILLAGDKTFKGVSKDAAFVIDTLTGSDFSSGLNEGGTVDMDNYLKYVGNTKYKEGIEEGISKELLRIVKNFILNGYDFSVIHCITGISIEQYNQIKDKIENNGDSFKPSDLF